MSNRKYRRLRYPEIERITDVYKSAGRKCTFMTCGHEVDCTLKVAIDLGRSEYHTVCKLHRREAIWNIAVFINKVKSATTKCEENERWMSTWQTEWKNMKGIPEWVMRQPKGKLPKWMTERDSATADTPSD
jgi:hypothetical protein